MSNPLFRTLACLALLGGLLRAQGSEYPLALNLPTAERMQAWDISVAFTHRFEMPVQGHGRDLYGLDGHAYPGFGFQFGIRPVPGLNAQIYRTADHKTYTLALQQQVLDQKHVRLAVRGEYFTETVQDLQTPLGESGIAGAVFQVPAEWLVTDAISLSLVPTYLGRTATRDKGLVTFGAGFRVDPTEHISVLGEFYPEPSGLEGNYRSGWALGVAIRTFKHRFTLIGTNTLGSTAHQVLGGDYNGGPAYYGGSGEGSWSLGFNIVRIF